MLAAIISAASDYWDRVREWARSNSDGCTKVADIYVDCCYEHDYHYRYARRLDGTPISRAEADAEFRRCIQKHSKFGVFSPVSWARWLGVRAGGWLPWKNHRKNDNGSTV